MIEFDIRVDGLKETTDRLADLDRRLRVNIVRRALRAGLKVTLQPLKDAAYQTNVKRTGLLARSLAVKIQRVSKKTPEVGGIITANEIKGGRAIRLGKKGGGNDARYRAFYWRFLEYGTAARKTASGANRGAGPVRAWAKPVVQARARQMVERFRDAVAAGIDQELQRMGQPKT